MEFVPPRKVFQVRPQDPVARHQEGTYNLPDFLQATLTKTGGMASVFQGHPFPRKGFIYDEGVITASKIKRATLAFFQPFASINRGLIGFLESFLLNFVRLSESIAAEATRPPFLHYQYYSEFCKATHDFTFLFLRKIGISFAVAERMGTILATIFQNDDAYYFRLMDIMSEATLEGFLDNPRKEVIRLSKIYQQREKAFGSSENDERAAGNRILRMIKMVSYLLYIPAVKRAFRFALKGTEFKWFQYDDWDYYWTLNRMDFDTLGKGYEERKEIQIKMMFEYAKKMNPGKEVKRVEEEGQTRIITI